MLFDLKYFGTFSNAVTSGKEKKMLSKVLSIFFDCFDKQKFIKLNFTLLITTYVSVLQIKSNWNTFQTSKYNEAGFFLGVGNTCIISCNVKRNKLESRSINSLNRFLY